MLTSENLNYILALIALGSVLFSIWNKIRNPQVSLERQQAVHDAKEEGKANVLADALQWEKEANERRFANLTAGLQQANSLAQNHLNHVDAKVDTLTATVNAMNINITGKLTELSTKLEERMPKRL